MPIIKTRREIEAAAAAADVPMLTPEEVLEQLHALRERIPELVQLPKTAVTRQIRRTARINIDFAREAFSSVSASAVVQEVIGNTPEELQDADREVTRWTAVEGELESLLRGVAAANMVRRQRIARVALKTYNVTRELVKEEEHADLLPFVERMKRLPKFGRRRRESEPQAEAPAPQTPSA